MSKKRKSEWGLFLNHRNRITYNKLCLQCQKDCKQSFHVLVIQCPKYQRKVKENGSVGYAEDLKNGCNSHGEAIILNPSRRDTTIIHYSFKFQIAQQSDKQKFASRDLAPTEGMKQAESDGIVIIKHM